MTEVFDRRFRPSKRLAAIGGYAFDEVNRRVEALKAQGISPIDFGVGDPTVPTPAVARGPRTMPPLRARRTIFDG